MILILLFVYDSRDEETALTNYYNGITSYYWNVLQDRYLAKDTVSM